MKKLIPILLLMVSTSVFAKWTEVDGSDDRDQTAYADFGTIKRKGHKVKMWRLHDFKTVHEVAGDRYLSQLERDEYDCEEETTRILDLNFYSGNMRQGGIVASSSNIKDEGYSVTPESVGETFFKIACGKK